MTKIAVISDTHSLNIPVKLLKQLKEFDLIIHAGDFCELSDAVIFENAGPKLKAVHGNRDDGAICKKYPRKNVFKVEDVVIGLYHGEGPRKQVLNRVVEEFAKDTVDLVVFGHTHEALIETIGTVTYLNPGSPNDEIFAPYCSYGIIEIDGADFSTEIIKLT